MSRLRDEFLEREVLWSVRDVQTQLCGWRRYYNEERLHSRIGYRTPVDFAAAWREKETAKAGETKQTTGTIHGG